MQVAHAARGGDRPDRLERGTGPALAQACAARATWTASEGVSDGVLGASLDVSSGAAGSSEAEERAYIEIMAPHALGRHDEARPQADAFLQRYPSSAFAPAIRKADAARRRTATPGA